MRPELDCNTLDEFSDLKRLEMVSPRCRPVVCPIRFVTCAVAVGETTVRWSPCSRSVLCTNRLAASVGGVVSP